MSDQTPEISLEAYAAERETGVTIDVREHASTPRPTCPARS